MQLHWDGNNTKVEERNKSAAFGTGTTPPTIDLKAIGRVEEWLLDEGAAASIRIRSTREGGARRADLHSSTAPAATAPERAAISAGEHVGKVTPHRRDRHRSAPARFVHLRARGATSRRSTPAIRWRFTHFRKTFGYANMPLDGLWLRAPYLHNGSVPTLRDLLEPAAKRAARCSIVATTSTTR